MSTCPCAALLTGKVAFAGAQTYHIDNPALRSRLATKVFMFNWLTNLFRRSGFGATGAQAHMTFGATAAGRSITRTGLFLKKQLWVWPIIAVVLLACIGLGIRVAIERTMKASLRSQLQTLLSVERSMVETWLHIQEQNAQSLANDQHVREIVAQLLAVSQPSEDDEPRSST